MKKSYWWLLAILIIAAVLRFNQLTAFDLVTDNALYSWRALGWFDYLGGGQTTPVQWFGYIPWWANFSFHDAPPLVFFLQKLFFSVFGDNTLAARLPFALAGVVAVYGVFKWLAAAGSTRAGLIGALTLAVSTYAIWGGRLGWLEGIGLMIVPLALWAFTRLDQKPEFRQGYLWSGLVIGLGLLTKYTLLFLPLGLGLYLLIWRRPLWQQKKFWLNLLVGLGLLVLVLLPVIVYNLGVWTTRGHFDAALSSMIGLHPTDFQTIAARSTSFSLGKVLAVLGALGPWQSKLFSLLLAVSSLWLVGRVVARRARPEEKICLAVLLAAIIIFSLAGSGERWLPVVVPLLAGVVGLTVDGWLTGLATKPKIWSYGLATLVGLVLVGETVFAVGTNWPLVSQRHGWFSPALADHVQDRGWNELENWSRKNIFPPDLKRQPVRFDHFLQFQPTDITDHNVVFYDDRVDWFAYSWYIQKYQIYYHLPLLPLSSLIKDQTTLVTTLKELGQLRAKGIYIILTADDGVRDSVLKKNQDLARAVTGLATSLESQGIKPVSIINSAGQTSFKIYQLKKN